METLTKICDCVPKDFDPVAFAPKTKPSPLGVLRCEQETFRMWHQAQHSTCRVTEAGNVGNRAIWILRFRQQTDASRVARCFEHLGSRCGPVTCGNLRILPKLIKQLWRLERDTAFSVRHRNVELIEAFQEDAVAGRYLQSHPAVGVSTIAVPCQRHLIFPRLLCHVFNGTSHKQSGLQNRLKAVADTKQQLIAPQKFPHSVVQLSSKLARKNYSRTKVVSIAEPARDTQNLILAEPGRIFEQSEKMDSFRRRTRQLKRVSRLNIAIRTRVCSTQTRSSHEIQFDFIT